MPQINEKYDFVFKGLSALMLPVLAWVLALTSNLATIEQKLVDTERRLNALEVDNKELEKELHDVSNLLASTTAKLSFIAQRMGN